MIVVVSAQMSIARGSPATAAAATSAAVMVARLDRVELLPVRTASTARRAIERPETYASAHPR